MNNQLKLPWIQTYRAILLISSPAWVTSALETIGRIGRQLGRTGQMRPQQELGRGYAEFAARRHSLR